jgi:5'-phosphate synthase pdxT subunit
VDGKVGKPTVGVLAYQGSVDAHAAALERCGAKPVLVKHTDELAGIQGLVIPGGESTTLLRLLNRFSLSEPLRVLIAEGLPVFGTCAGLILLAKHVVDGEPSPLGFMDITARRNAYGRQVDSFTAELTAPVFGSEPVHCVFIRAPRIIATDPSVEVLARWDGEPIVAQQGPMLVASFHPELTNDSRIHAHFLNMIANRSGKAS